MTLADFFDQGLAAFRIANPDKEPGPGEWHVLYTKWKVGQLDPELNSIDLDAPVRDEAHYFG